jgi:hypothetical protein
MLRPLVKDLCVQLKQQRKRKEDVMLLWPMLTVLNLSLLLLKLLAVLAKTPEISLLILQDLLPLLLRSGLLLKQDFW